MSGWLGVMAVDPGGTTGVAWGVFPLDVKLGPGARVKKGRRLGSAEVTGDYQYQAARIVEQWREFDRMCSEAGVRSVMVMEDFILRPGKASADRAQLMPVRLAACIEGILIEERVGCAMPLGGDGWRFGLALGVESMLMYQQPSAAKGYASDARLRRWGLWQVGSRHCRDAWRHVLLQIAESTSKTP